MNLLFLVQIWRNKGAGVVLDFFFFTAYIGAAKLPFKPEGYNFWTWRGHKIHYVVQGEGSPVVLIHGFGASAFHWRFTF